MFDRTTIQQGRTEYVPFEKTVNITEKRAPTDESVRLLNEFQEKARENIIKTVTIDSNIAKCVCIYYNDYTVDYRFNFQLKFILNGKEHIISGSIDRNDMNKITRNCLPNEFHQHVFEFFYKKFAECIAAELIMQDTEFLRRLSSF